MRPVAMTIVIAERRVLLIQRLENAHHFRWCPPGGKIEQGESVLEAAIRELREETSLVAADAVILGHRPSKEFDAMLHRNISQGTLCAVDLPLASCDTGIFI